MNAKVKIKAKPFWGMTGRIIGSYWWSDGMTQKVCLDKPVDNKCIYWFKPEELVKL